MRTCNPAIDAAIAEYCQRLTAAYIQGCCGGRHYAADRIDLYHEALPGPVYVRIARVEKIKQTGEILTRSAVAFVKLEDGSIWKPAGWKGPAKNFSRGNVYNPGAFVAWSL